MKTYEIACHTGNFSTHFGQRTTFRKLLGAYGAILATQTRSRRFRVPTLTQEHLGLGGDAWGERLLARGRVGASWAQGSQLARCAPPAVGLVSIGLISVFSALAFEFGCFFCFLFACITFPLPMCHKFFCVAARAIPHAWRRSGCRARMWAETCSVR